MSYTRPRLTGPMLNDARAAATTLAEGNPGALSVIMQLITSASEGKVDPDSAISWFGPLASLDNLDLYGPHIWMLYKDVCGQDIVKMQALLRGHQMGVFTEEEILEAVTNAERGLPYTLKDMDVVARLQTVLPRFASFQPPLNELDKAHQIG